MRVERAQAGAVARETVREVLDDDLQGAAAEVAYHLLFSIVPLFIFLTALSGVISRAIGVDDVMVDVTRWLAENLPAETAAAVIDPIEEVLHTEASGLLSFGFLAALWGARNAMAALLKGLNTAFDAEERRPWWKRQLLAIGLVVGLGLALVGASAVFVYGSFFGGKAAGLIGLDGAWELAWAIAQWPLIILLLITGLALLYWAGPDVDVPFRWVTPGAVLAVVCWAAATYGLGIYFAHFAGYTAYGALGAVMAFIFWLYVMSLILLIGGEVNAVASRLAAEAGQAEQRVPRGTPLTDGTRQPASTSRRPATAESTRVDQPVSS